MYVSSVEVGESVNTQLLKVSGISKSFPGVQALKDVEFELNGERSSHSSVKTAPASPAS